MTTFSEWMEPGEDRKVGLFDDTHSLRQIGWLVAGGPYDGEISPMGTVWPPAPGSLHPVYIEIEA